MYTIRSGLATASANTRSSQSAVTGSSERIPSGEGNSLGSIPSSNRYKKQDQDQPSIVPSHKQQFEPTSVPQLMLPCAKRKKFSSEYTVPNQVTVSEESVKLCETDFVCRICLNLLKDPHIIPCGHSYCYACIKDCNKCPSCKEIPHRLVPNKILGEIVEKFKRKREFH